MIHIDSTRIDKDSYGEYEERVGIFELEGDELKDPTEAIKNEFKLNKCSHEYDCCGCVCRIDVENVTHVKRDYYSAVIKFHFNV